MVTNVSNAQIDTKMRKCCFQYECLLRPRFLFLFFYQSDLSIYESGFSYYPTLSDLVN